MFDAAPTINVAAGRFTVASEDGMLYRGEVTKKISDGSDPPVTH